ncbi:hypothetical protein LUZ61_019601 [Rhynchospora tenuis]|uniref:Methyltransferase type 11 domain-containing protein n=1 Tax=Rhynchospora tenuis TaxID=198213 RepID=A0AAD6EN20_9POAL|nr:hypothetical protein LUZ61_019601 [Rhynchospora tenuis]
METKLHHRFPLRNHLFYILLLITSNLITFYLFSSPPHGSSPSSSTLSVTPPTTPSFPSEYYAFTGPHKLPFGHNPNMDSSLLNPPLAQPCLLSGSLLTTFLSYNVNSSCPDDEPLSQKLLLRGCDPLPIRRCRPASPKNPVPPLPYPDSLWTTPPDENIHWSAYTCKSFKCLVDRIKTRSFDDCKDCFDLSASGREIKRWVTPSTNPLDFTIDEVLSLAKPPNSIRIGLDLGGGSGTFAVRMRERNVTMVASTLNLNGPFSNFIASRGIIPLYTTVGKRLPIFDNTLDIVHSMHVLSNWIPTTVLHFVLFDVYRVLRPGGLFWLDHFFFVEGQMEEYVSVIESVGFEKLKWEIGRKLDRGAELKEMYISALLQKPLKNSW